MVPVDTWWYWHISQEKSVFLNQSSPLFGYITAIMHAGPANCYISTKCSWQDYPIMLFGTLAPFLGEKLNTYGMLSQLQFYTHQLTE